MKTSLKNLSLLRNAAVLGIFLSIVILSGCTGTKNEAVTLTPDEVQEIAQKEGKSVQDVLFDDGNYAMFIHFGLYSKMEGEWKGKSYYGNAEWIMNGNQAGIPVKEYMAEASTFNPDKFDANEIVQLAKDAGMKYIIITSKHHEGFAMFQSAVSDFNIADATPFGRDLIGELAQACHENGLGIGFYYSQWQDWTAPGGGNGPTTDDQGREVSFEEYFRTKCAPQVEEITTKYGDIELIWFDTPGELEPQYSKELVDIVRKNQPNALVSSRVGNGLGDYETLGDMEVPTVNHEGRWEGIDVTQVGWGFSKADHRFKTPEYIVQTLFSTIARGGTFMMNVGPTKEGLIAPEAADALRKAGQWVHRHPRAIYRAQASPWKHALPWGDAVMNDGKLYLAVYDYPTTGQLYVPGVNNKVKSVCLDNDKALGFRQEGSWLIINVPLSAPDEMATVIEVTPEGTFDIDPTVSADPDTESLISIETAQVSGTKVERSSWMENFGEWKVKGNAHMNDASVATWEIDFPTAGFYDVNLEYRANDRHEWRVSLENGTSIEHSCGPSSIFSNHPLGWIRIEKPGKMNIQVRLLTGAQDDAELSGIVLSRVNM